MKYLPVSLLSILALVPSLAFAVTDLFSAEALVLTILSKLGYFFMILSIVAFFYGLVKFIANTSDPTEKEKGKSVMLWGVIAFVVMFSLWTLVSLIFDSLQINITPVTYVDKNGNIVN